MRYVFLAISTCFLTSVFADTRPATEAEILETREAIFRLVPESQILNIRVWADDRRLGGDATLRPDLVRDGLCIRRAIHVRRPTGQTEFETPYPESHYYWRIAPGQQCDVTDLDETPQTVLVKDIPTDDVLRIMDESDTLVAQARAATWCDEAMDDWFGPGVKVSLRSIELHPGRVLDVGNAYTAHYQVVGMSSAGGPWIRFSITPSGFEIHGVCYWVS